MEDIFTAINRQLKYDIFYSDDELDVARKIKLTDSKMEVSKLLKEVLQDDYSYEFLNKTIVIRPVKQQQNPKIVIQGTVKDTKGIPLPGVSVVIQGSTVGVSADNAGKFRMEVADLPDLVLVFSFVGMETREIPYRGEKELSVVLSETQEELGEVIVTGYQRVDKRESTSAVSVIKTDDLKTIGATSIEQMLQGQLPGLSVVNTSAGPGATPKIRVRGTATIAGNADPLWVLDGVILENSVPLTVSDLNSPDVMTMFNSAIGGISPNDIESITVLKDASATAIYGTRAANGVIVVTS